MTDRYHTVDVPVRGGDLRVGIWEPESGAEDAPTVLAVHGITTTHRSWLSVARRLPDTRIVAPDLRGRGRSNGLPGPYGIRGHADDLARVLDHLDVPAATVMGHSMGGWVTVATVHRHRTRVTGVVLVDGGLPLLVPEGLTPDEATAAVLGPVQRRLSMTFPDHEAHRAYFRAHPAFSDWTDATTDYVDYDLVGEPGNYRPATSLEASSTDFRSQLDGEDWLLPGLAALPPGTPFLRAPRGLLDEEPGLFPAHWVAKWAGRFPAVDVREVPGTNHYTLLSNERGLAAIAGALAAVGATRG
jgi:pimeloyl-ACP methyl ester carboxylesterase